MRATEPRPEPPRSERPSLVVPLALLAIGLAAVVAGAGWNARAAKRFVAQGAFWRAYDAGGAVLLSARDELPGGLRLHDGSSLELESPGGAAAPWRSASFVVERVEEWASLEIELRDGPRGAELLRIGPAKSFGVLHARREAGERLVPVTQRPDVDLFGAIARPIRVDLRLGDTFTDVAIGDEFVLRAQDLPPAGARLTVRVRGGRVILHGLEAEVGAAAGTPAPHVLRADFEGLREASAWAPALRTALRLSLLPLLLFVWFAVLVLGRASVRELVRAAAAAALPLLLFAAAFLAAPRDYSLPALIGLGSLAFVTCLVVGIRMLRERLAPAAEGPLVRARGVLITLAVVALSVHSVGGHWLAARRPLLQDEEYARALPVPQAPPPAGPASLGPHNAIVFEGPYRDFELRLRCRLGPDAVLHVRSRAQRAQWAEGVVLVGATHPGEINGFVRETRGSFSRIGELGEAVRLEAGRDCELRIRAEGRRFVATLDGALLASAEETLFPAGGIVVLAAHGDVDLERAEVEPLPAGAPERLRSVLAAAPGLLPACFLIVCALLLMRALSLPGLRAAEMTALALLPVSLFFLVLPPSRPPDAFLAGCAALLSIVVLLVPTLVHARRLRAPYFFLLCGTALAGAWFIVRHSDARPLPFDDLALSQMSVTDGDLDSLHLDLLHVQHPLVRRWNSWLAQHEFRGRRHDLAKSEGVARVIALGTSSTYGHSSQKPWPLQLEERLNGRGVPVEVINAGISGSCTGRLHFWLRSVLLRFEPDVVVISQFFNDSYALSQLDDRACLEQFASPDVETGTIDAWKLRLAVRAGVHRFQQWNEEFRAGRAFAPPADGASPPELFERNLRDLAALARGAGARVVFMKEAVRGNADRLWKREFYAAIDRVAKELGAPVVDASLLLLERGGEKLFADDVHPFDDGDAVIAEVVEGGVREALGLPPEPSPAGE